MFRKAQISAEFFMFIGLVFIIAIAFEIASIDQLKHLRLQKESDAIKDVALKLQMELLIAATVEDGYVRIFELPESVENVNYSIMTQNSSIIITSKNSFYIVAVPYSSGNISKGTNLINKTGGVIYIN
ncbi:hypothetical protein HYW99_03720 [Candidatus Woesearchaeota archaeon]|nr:hypothetical protein [Candidatus Woesearchaeota archaeon]